MYKTIEENYKTLINKIKELSKWKDILHSWMKVKVLVVPSCSTLWSPWTIACQAPLSMEFSRHEYWSGLPCPPPGDLPNPGLPHFRRFFTVCASRESHEYWIPFSRGSSWPRNQIGVSFIAGGFFTSWATREAMGYYLVLKKEMSYQSMKRHGGNFNTYY